MFIVNLLSRR